MNFVSPLGAKTVRIQPGHSARLGEWCFGLWPCKFALIVTQSHPAAQGDAASVSTAVDAALRAASAARGIQLPLATCTRNLAKCFELREPVGEERTNGQSLEVFSERMP